MLNYYYRNTKRPDGMVLYKFFKLVMFGSCESSTNFGSDDTIGSDIGSFFCFIFSRSTNLMEACDPEH